MNMHILLHNDWVRCEEHRYTCSDDPERADASCICKTGIRRPGFGQDLTEESRGVGKAFFLL